MAPRLDRIPFERRGIFLAACHGVRPGEIRAPDAGDLEEREWPKSASGWHSSRMPLKLVRRMLRHRGARSMERYAKLSDWALVEAFGAHHERDQTRRRRGRAHGVLMSPNQGRKHQRNQALWRGGRDSNPPDIALSA